jgi:uncharacterized membrane protein
MTDILPETTVSKSSLTTAKVRIPSIDLLRGLVMVIMPLDHLRDLLHLGHPEPTDLHITTPVLFFTRWITHFCAPTFVFLSGISALLAGKNRNTHQLAGFLLKRGLWLIIVELMIINLIASLDVGYHVIVLQVIWAIGGSMVLLGLLVWMKLNPTTIGIIGLFIFLGHNVIDRLPDNAIHQDLAWRVLLSSDGFSKVDTIVPGHVMIAAYALLPWCGVMLVGYGLGQLYLLAADERKRMLARLGLGLLVFFFLFRLLNIYGDPSPWSVQQNGWLTFISFLNVTKYPCSLLYLCITLGVALLLLAYTEKAGNRLSKILIVYGNVPFLYYVLHWALAQTITIVLFFATGHHLQDMNPDKTGFPFSPNNVGVPLAGVYLAWPLLLFVLYFPCRWFGQYKRTHRQWWLSYL